MKTITRTISVAFVLARTTLALACGPGGATGSEGPDDIGDDIGDSTGEADGGELPAADLPPDDREPGWCCECASLDAVGHLDCTPSSAASCSSTGWEWCQLDAYGDPSDCASACEPDGDGDGDDDPLGWCCDCDSPTDSYPYIECTQLAGSECGSVWCEPGADGNAGACVAECAEVIEPIGWCCNCVDGCFDTLGGPCMNPATGQPDPAWWGCDGRAAEACVAECEFDDVGHLTECYGQC
jgi:hypothetical protein